MSEDICDGVKILVERMKTNPEEFTEDFGKWDGLVNPPWHTDLSIWLKALNDAEIAMLQEGMRKIYREMFTARVMKTLLKVDDAPKQPSVTLTAKSTLAPNPNPAQNVYNPYQNSVIAVGSAGGGGLTGTNTPMDTSMMERFEKAWKEYKKGNKK